MNCALPPLGRERQRALLLAHARPHPNSAALAEILASWHCGDGVLPAWLGLEPAVFELLHHYHFGGVMTPRAAPWQATLDPRLDELRLDLLNLLLLHARDDSPSVTWVAELIATACQGSNHLWEDLGVWHRASLSQLLGDNFPTLAARNTRDMKWKKFLFKQLCETEGLYICRAPSCDECADFNDCFGPE